MANNGNDATLRYRNESSLYLDDLVALVVNSSMASELRRFSGEIMELTPGFAFSQKQAKKLRDQAQRALKQYQARELSDAALMNCVAEMRTILKGEEETDGGKHMGIIHKIVHGKQIKQEESLRELDRQYKEVCKRMLECEDEMARCVSACQGVAPGSMVYRNSERGYNDAKRELAMLKKQEQQLGELMDSARRIQLVKDFGVRQKEIAALTNTVLGSEKDRDITLATAETHTEMIGSKLDEVGSYGESLFAETEESAAPVDSEFASLVASNERRQTTLDMPGGMQQTARNGAAQMSEFDRLVNGKMTD